MNLRLCINIFILFSLSFMLGGCWWYYRWADDIHAFAVVEKNITAVCYVDSDVKRILLRDDICKERGKAGLPVYGKSFFAFNPNNEYDRFSDVNYWIFWGRSPRFIYENTYKYEIRNVAENVISTIELKDDYCCEKIREISRYILKNGYELKIDCAALVENGEYKIKKIAYFYGRNQNFREITKDEFFAKKEELFQDEGGQGK